MSSVLEDYKVSPLLQSTAGIYSYLALADGGRILCTGDSCGSSGLLHLLTDGTVKQISIPLPICVDIHEVAPGQILAVKISGDMALVNLADGTLSACSIRETVKAKPDTDIMQGDVACSSVTGTALASVSVWESDDEEHQFFDRSVLLSLSIDKKSLSAQVRHTPFPKQSHIHLYSLGPRMFACADMGDGGSKTFELASDVWAPPIDGVSIEGEGFKQQDGSILDVFRHDNRCSFARVDVTGRRELLGSCDISRDDLVDLQNVYRHDNGALWLTFGYGPGPGGIAVVQFDDSTQSPEVERLTERELSEFFPDMQHQGCVCDDGQGDLLVCPGKSGGTVYRLTRQ